MSYKISTLDKKSVIQREIWVKDGREAVYEIGWRWGSVVTDKEPDLSDYDPNVGIDPMEAWDAELWSFDDGCWSSWEYPENMTEEEQAEFDAAYDENSDEGIEMLGWLLDDTEYRFIGPLEVEEVKD